MRNGGIDMNNTFKEILSNRRSVRMYTGEAVPAEALDLVVRTGLMTPRGRNLPSVELIVVKDKAALEFLSECRPHGPGMLAGADAAVIVLGNSAVSDVWTEDCCASMTAMHLMADSLGLGSCWVQIRGRESKLEGKTAEDVCREFFGFPENYRMEAVLSIGIPKLKNEPKSFDDVDLSMIHTERF